LKVIKFRIKNYKSIYDSGECYLDDKITILAGKNEAGKTAILEALEDFNINNKIRNQAIPLQNKKKNLKPEISITLKLEYSDLKVLKEKKEIINEIDEIEITKKYPDIYQLVNISPEKEYLNLQNLSKIRSDILKIISSIKKKIQIFPVDENLLENPSQLSDTLSTYQLQFNPNVNENEKGVIKKQISRLKKMVDNLKTASVHRAELLEIIKQNYIPNFILFKTFNDILPTQKPISEASSIQIIKDLSIISGLDFNKIQPSADAREKEKHRENINLKFTKDYKQFWTQDHANLQISWDSNNIYFWIKEGNELYTPEMRSKGKQWHLSFYIRVTARSYDNNNDLILIDEPGLFLHAKAQKDILKKLEECAKRKQIIYATHSPYLISSGHLNRVRLVINKIKKGTTIEKLTANADKETLTPILTAIGEDLSYGIRTDKKNSVVVEGFSDYLWLISFKNLLGVEEELNFVPSIGAGNEPYIGAILFGWGLNPIFILDNDNNGRNTKQKLINSLSIKENRIILLPQNKEGEIENLFSKNDARKYTNLTQKNNKSKILLASEFHRKVENGEITIQDLSTETIKNIKNIFKALENITVNNET